MKQLNEADKACYRDYGYHTPIDVMSQATAFRLLKEFERAEVNFPEALGPFGRNNAHLPFMCLDEIAHKEVILDSDGIITNSCPGDLIVDFSTVLPETSDNLYGR